MSATRTFDGPLGLVGAGAPLWSATSNVPMTRLAASMTPQSDA